MAEKILSITCPLCGRKYDKPVKELFEGADMICPLCGVKLNLHGHMWKGRLFIAEPSVVYRGLLPVVPPNARRFCRVTRS